MSNNITKTIMESLEDDLIDTLVWYIRQADSKHEAFEYIKSHLLQSQIRLIEAVIEEIRSKLYKTDISNDPDSYLLPQYQQELGAYNARYDQISSLNETLEELKKSL